MYQSLEVNKTIEALKKCNGQMLHAMIDDRCMYLDLLAQENIGNARFGECPEAAALAQDIKSNREIREKYLIF